MKYLKFILCLGILWYTMVYFGIPNTSAFNWSTNSIVAYWNMDTGTGTTALDIAAGRHPATLSGITNWTNGKLGNSTYMRGAGTLNVSHSTNLNLVGNFSLQAWVRPNSTDNTMAIITKTDGTTANYLLWIRPNGLIDFRYYTIADGWVNSQTNTGATPLNQWTHIIAVLNDSAMDIYVNGEFNTSSSRIGKAVPTFDTGDLLMGYDFDAGGYYFNGSIDEIGIWNKTLNTSEVRELYGNTYGLAFNATGAGSAAGLVVSLASPSNAAVLPSTTYNFTATYLPSGTLTLSNGTYFIWYNNGTLYNSTFRTVTGGVLNTTTVTFFTFPLGSYVWNVRSCGENASTTYCTFADSNYSFTTGITIINSSYDSMNWETDYKNFTTIVSYNPIYSISNAYLVYNGTEYPATVSSGSGISTLSRALDLPLTRTQSEFREFYWKLNLFDSSGIYQFNTEIKNQTVNRTYFVDCNATYSTLALNYTVYDEANHTRIQPFSFINAALRHWLGSGSVSRNYSFGQNLANETNLCIYPSDRNFHFDIHSEYTAPNYVTRNLLYGNESTDALDTHIPLYLLLTASSTTFIQKVQDSDLIPMENVYIYTQRYYPETNAYETVAVSRTGSDGKTVGFYKTETVEYRHVLTDANGKIILITGKQKVFAESVPYTITFTVGEAIDTPWTDLENDKDKISFTLAWNKTSKITTYTYVHDKPTFVSARLWVTRVNNSGVDLTICNTTSLISSSILTCDLSAYTTGDFVIKAYRHRTGYSEELIKVTRVEISDSVSVFGKEGLLLAWFIILTAGLIFFWNPMIAVWAVTLATIFVNLIGLAKFSPLYVFSMIAVSIILTIVIKSNRSSY